MRRKCYTLSVSNKNQWQARNLWSNMKKFETREDSWNRFNFEKRSLRKFWKHVRFPAFGGFGHVYQHECKMLNRVDMGKHGPADIWFSTRRVRGVGSGETWPIVRYMGVSLSSSVRRIYHSIILYHSFNQIFSFSLVLNTLCWAIFFRNPDLSEQKSATSWISVQITWQKISHKIEIVDGSLW